MRISRCRCRHSNLYASGHGVVVVVDDPAAFDVADETLKQLDRVLCGEIRRGDGGLGGKGGRSFSSPLYRCWGHAPFSKRERSLFSPFFYSPLYVTVRRFSPRDVDGHQASNQWATSSSARIVCHSRVTSGNDVSRSVSIRNLIRRGIALFFFFLFFFLHLYIYGAIVEEKGTKWI